MKTILALVLLVMAVSCGGDLYSTIYTVDSTVKQSERVEKFDGIIVWEFGKELKPWGLKNGSMFRLIDDKPTPEIYHVLPSTLMFNKKTVTKNLFKDFYRQAEGKAMFLELSGLSFYIKYFDGTQVRDVFGKPINGNVVQTMEDMLPAVAFNWDPWRGEFLFSCSADANGKIRRYRLAHNGKPIELAETHTFQFIPAPRKGLAIEGTLTPELVGTLVTLDGKGMLLRSCFARYLPGSDDAFYISEGKCYGFSGDKLVEIGKVPQTPMLSFFGIHDWKPFTLLHAGEKKVRVAFFNQ